MIDREREDKIWGRIILFLMLALFIYLAFNTPPNPTCGDPFAGTL